MNVATNFIFMLVGLAGLAIVPKARSTSERVMFTVFFLGILLTGFGSAWYHLDPNNDSLVWDRLPMTIVFTSFLAFVIRDRIDAKAGAILLTPLVLSGILCTLYWRWTEGNGAGDLRPYAFVQLFPLVAIPLILVLFPQKILSGHLLTALVLYLIAKTAEHFDNQIYAALVYVSGHSLKHLIAGFSVFCLFLLIKARINAGP